MCAKICLEAFMLIGVTGYSGSGKSYISKLIASELDAEIIDFDEISHTVVSSQTYKEFVAEQVSKDVFDSNGNIITKKLGEILWDDTILLQKVNKFAEAKMIEIIDKKLQKISKKYEILDYALLPTMKYFDLCDIKILIKSTKQTRFKRLKQRENITKKYFEAREKAQPEFKNYKFDIIYNNSQSSYPNKLLKLIKEKLCLEKQS